MSCCGKEICSGCFYAPVYDNHGNEVAEKKCAFCRVPHPTSDEEGTVERMKKRMQANDPLAIYNLGLFYRNKMHGLPEDHTKALEYWHRAGKLGYTESYSCIGLAYELGRGVEVDMKKAKHYYELAAMGGCVVARYNLGINETRLGNMDRALKHHMIAARNGLLDSLDKIKQMYSDGYVTKEEYSKALRTYQTYLGEIKSRQRDKAAAVSEEYRYY